MRGEVVQVVGKPEQEQDQCAHEVGPHEGVSACPEKDRGESTQGYADPTDARDWAAVHLALVRQIDQVQGVGQPGQQRDAPCAYEH